MLKKSSVSTSVLIMCFCLFFNACGPQKPAEPTPDLQASMKAGTQMESWLTDIRIGFFFASEGLANIDDALLTKERSGDESLVRNLLDHYNAPGNLVETLTRIFENSESIRTQLASVQGIDTESFSNLGELNKTFNATLTMLKAIPDNPADFREKVGTQKGKFTSIETLLIKKFPNSTAMLSQRKSPENPEFRKFKQLLEPKFQPAAAPVAEPTKPQDEPKTDAVPDPNAPVEPQMTAAPSKVWRDAQGNIHMGQVPPDGVVVEEPRGSIAQGSLLPPNTPAPTSTPVVTRSDVAPASQIVRDEAGRIILKNIAEPTPAPAGN